MIIILLFVGLLVWFIIGMKQKAGACVAVYIAGDRVIDFSLKQDTEYVIETEEGTNQLIIYNQKAYIAQADCKDKICAEHSAISKTGESIVCLPHKVVVQIEDGEESEIDGISQ